MSSPQEMANLVSRTYTIGQFCFFLQERGRGLGMHVVLTEVLEEGLDTHSLLDSFPSLSSVGHICNLVLSPLRLEMRFLAFEST